MDDWCKRCVDSLTTYKIKMQSIAHLEADLAEVTERCKSIPAVRYDKERISCNKVTNPSDQWDNDIALRQDIERRLRILRYDINKVNKTLGLLPSAERLILLTFYIERQPRFVERLMDMLRLERSSVYRAKNKALKSYALLACGDCN